MLTFFVIYGANSGGKSSVIDAIKSIIKNSVDVEKSKHYRPCPFLLSKETEEKQTIFEIEFVIEQTIYRYGFEINTEPKILKEWLFYFVKLIVILYSLVNVQLLCYFLAKNHQGGGNSFKLGTIIAFN